MDEDEALKRLGEEVTRRRKELYLSVAQAAARAPMVASTWTNVEQCRRVTMSTWAGVERVLGWTVGSCRAILAGGEATLADKPAPPPGDDNPYREDAEAALRWAESRPPGPLRDMLRAAIQATLEQEPDPLPQPDRPRPIR